MGGDSGLGAGSGRPGAWGQWGGQRSFLENNLGGRDDTWSDIRFARLPRDVL